MVQIFSNLYPIRINWDDLKLYLYEARGIPNTKNKRKILNRLRYRLSTILSSPVFYATEGDVVLFYTFSEGNKELEIQLSEDVLYNLIFKGKVQPPPPNRNIIEWIVEDLIRLKRLKEKFQRENLIKANTPFGEIFIYPSPFAKVYGNRNFLLQVDFKFNLTTAKTLQELLEKEILKPSRIEGNERYRLKPYGFDRTSYAVKVFKAAELDLKELESKLKISTRERTKREWKTLLDDIQKRKKTFLIQLENGYLYPATLIRPVLDFEKLGKASEILKKVKLPPKDRFKLVRYFTKVLAEVSRSFGVYIDNIPLKVGDKDFLPYHREVIDSQNITHNVEKSLLPFLVKCKPFVKKPVLKTKIIFIDNDENSEYRRKTLKLINELKNFLSSKSINLQIEKGFKFLGRNREEVIKQISENLGKILAGQPDLIVVFFPEYGVRNIFEEITLYDYLKKRFLENGIASQFVLKKTLLENRNLDFVVYNLAEQIMGKTGNIPYRLSKNLKGADVFIGLDISRVKRKSGGSVNEGAFTKIFFSNGSFLKYSLSSSTSFGEEFTQKAIYELFLRLRESGIKEGKRIVIHRDGFFRGKETELFTKLAEDFGYKLELVEVIKRNNPRFFAEKVKGLYLTLSDNEALVATYDSPPHSTHQPIRIRLVKGELPLKVHASYILSFTLLNYSSFKPVKLPATTYHTDRMAKLALRGLKPSKTEGEEMFWL